MDRTARAALLAGAIGLFGIGGLGLFLGIDPVPSLVTGVVLGALFALLILAAARRADSFEGPAPPSPRSPHGRTNGRDDRSTT